VTLRVIGPIVWEGMAGHNLAENTRAERERRMPAGAASGDPVSERKFVTILRADIVKSTDLVAELDPEEALSRLEPALAAMRAAVRQFGGVVSKETGDGLAAVFGAPVADDNHAPLACHAALELVRRVTSLGDSDLQIRVGLHSGLAIMYVVSSEFSKVYEIGGPASHLVARLEAAAEPGEIYASEACQKLSEGHIRFESLGLRALKGFADALPVYRVVAAGDPSRWRVRRTRSVARFVGRSPDMALLRHAAQASRSEGYAVCLTGDPGIGKSRLAHEFVQELKAEGWRLIEAGCSPNLQGSPFAALKGLLRSVLDGADLEGVADPREGMPRILRTAIDAVLDLPVSDDEWNKFEPSARGKAINDASRMLVEAAARDQRAVLLVEDVHWVDRASAPILTTLASLRSPDLLVLLTGRPDELPGWIQQCNVEVLALRALGESAGWSMLDDILGLSSTTYELKRRIIQHTANVPLCIEEVCRRLKETGVLIGEWGNLSLAQPVDDLGIPSSVQGVIAARLDRLTRQERTVAQAAAALGPRSKASVLRQVTAFSAMMLETSLNALDQSELLVKVAGTEEVLEFPHDMIRQVAYDSMIGAVREDVHGRILTALEGGKAADEEADKLCYHATRAKAWAKAFAYSRDVGRKCVARSAFADATTYYEIAMDAIDKTPVSRDREVEAIDLRTEARLAFMGFGRIAEWFDLGKEAERRANAIGDVGRKIATMTIRAGAENFYNTPVEAIDTGEQVVALAEQWGDRRWLSMAQYGLGQAYWYAGRYLEADQMYGRAFAELSRPEAAAVIGTTIDNQLLICCLMHVIVNINLGRLDVAEGYQRRVRELAERSNRPFDRVIAAYGEGSLMLARGDAQTAVAVLDEASALSKRHGVRVFIPAVDWQRGVAYLEQERLDEAKEILTEALETSKTIGYKAMELRSSLALAHVLSRLANVREALEMLRHVTNTAQQQGFAGTEAEARLLHATIMPITNDESRSVVVRHLRASIAISSRNGAEPLVAKAQALLDRIVAETGAVD
jgi:class 3 adenylate cyclase/tetratricopeptide (TPR) repeat protein